MARCKKGILVDGGFCNWILPLEQFQKSFNPCTQLLGGILSRINAVPIEDQGRDTGLTEFFF
jgi:hypothetical protein